MANPLSEEKQQQWREKFQTQRDSGLSIKQWCRENHITPQAFYYWRVRLFPTPDLSRSQFTEISDMKGGLSIEYKGISIHLHRNFDPITLKRCLTVLQEVKC